MNYRLMSWSLNIILSRILPKYSEVLHLFFCRNQNCVKAVSEVFIAKILLIKIILKLNYFSKFEI